jgi:hypothetical protein
METQRKRLVGIPFGTVLMMAFILAQPMTQANAVGAEGLPAYDECIAQRGFQADQAEDPISMNTVKNKNIVKTVHAEKEMFSCFLDQGNLPVIVDLTTYIEIYENIDDRKVIDTNAVATTCLKDNRTATVIDCESYVIPSTPVFVGSTCQELGYITHPQEMNTVNKGKIAKTIESQKEVFLCGVGIITTTTPTTTTITSTATTTFTTLTDVDIPLGVISTTITSTTTGTTTVTSTVTTEIPTTFKKVDVILFTDTYEDLSAHEVVEVQFHSVRCVILFTDNSDDRRDATVETCQFSTIEN